jgi:hypothetical protein
MLRKGFRSRMSASRRAIATYLAAATLAIMLFSCPLQAQVMVRPVNLAYLVQRADVIVQGQVTSVLHENLPGYANIPTIKVTLNVQEMMRGPAGSKYAFREIFLGLRSREGKRNYRVGQQVFLFLPTPSQFGLSSPIGMEQGRFHITSNPTGQATVMNEISNAGLFQNVAQAARNEGQNLTERQVRLITTERGPVQLDEFSSLVESLMSLKRIR